MVIAVTEAKMSWDLSPLVNGASPEKVKEMLDEVIDSAEVLAARFQDSIFSMNAEDVLELLHDLETHEIASHDLINYGQLRYEANTTDKEAAQLNNMSRKVQSTINQILAPIELRLGKLVVERPETVEDTMLEVYKHYLQRLQAEARYYLSEDVEKVIIEKNQNGIKLFEQLQSSWVSEKTYDVELEGEQKTLTYNELSALRMNPDRETRRMATTILYKSFADDSLLHSFALRSICADHLAMSKLRGQPSPMTQSLLDQDVDEHTIETLLSIFETTSDKFREFLGIKAKMMGLEKLEGHDVIAPITKHPEWSFSWDDARKIVVDSFSSFDHEFGQVVENMFTNRRIDSANRVGKTSGAFCSRHARAKSCFVFTTYNNTMNDLYTLAHELGHSVQGHVTCHRQNPLNWRTSACLAEMGSIFGELLLTEKILSMAETKAQKIEILSHVLNTFFYNVYYVGARALFEKSLYETIAQNKLLDSETACNLWNAAKKKVFGESVDWTEYMEYEWARIPHHFIANFRFYNYSYSFAQMLVFALYEVYQQEGVGFINRFRDLLGRGNTKSVREHLHDFGFDITDSGFWELGARQAERLLNELKELV